MTISSLATSKNITDKNYGTRKPSDIKWIVPHHMVAHWTGEYASDYFQTNGLENSVNYCIGYGGDISCNVYEEYGAWTSSNWRVDTQAFTIECSDTSTTDFTIPQPTQESLINLMVDFFKRYPSLGGFAVYDPNDASEVKSSKAQGRYPITNGNILLHNWTSNGATSCPGAKMIEVLPNICKEVNRKLGATKVSKYIGSLQYLGDGRYHYYDGKAMGIGCSEYTRLALVRAGIIKEGETFHAGSGNVGVLADTSRFQKIAWNPSSLKEGDILWSQGHHVATWDGKNGVYEAAPESTHGICDNGKTGVGHFTNHTYRNCGTGTNTWTCIYRIIDSVKRTLHEEAQFMIDNNINGKARYNQCVEDGFHYEEVQNEIDRMLAKDKSDILTAMIACLPTIQNGSTGDAVKVLQTELKLMGYYDGDIDGSFGSMTETALKGFQTNISKVYGSFGVDGVCGRKTWTKIFM